MPLCGQAAHGSGSDEVAVARGRGRREIKTPKRPRGMTRSHGFGNGVIARAARGPACDSSKTRDVRSEPFCVCHRVRSFPPTPSCGLRGAGKNYPHASV